MLSVGESGVRQHLLSVPILHDAATGENIYKLLSKELTDRNIPISNCISFGTDNANVMVGKHKGVYAFLKKDHESIHLSGWTCHLLHHAAEHGSKCLPFSIDENLATMYYFLEKSSKRLLLLEQFQTDIEHKKILKHVPTRWLSLKTCLDRFIENYDALRQFFKKESKGNVTADRLHVFMKSPTNHLYCLFLSYALESFCEVNVRLQAATPKIHCLRNILLSFLRKVLVMFVKPSAFIGREIHEVDYKSAYNHKDDVDLLIGKNAKSFIANRDENYLRPERIAEFYSVVKKFYSDAASYVIEKLPFNDEVIRKASVADIDKRVNAKFSDLEYFLNRFNCLMPKGCDKDTVELEFAMYQTSDFVVGEAIDKTWADIGKIKHDGAQDYIFKNLSHVMLGILCIPHSNAQCERVFSCVRKNKTFQRALLGSQTLSSLMVCKSRPGECYSRSYTTDELKALRSGYKASLQKQ